jgi:hypothetical protein
MAHTALLYGNFGISLAKRLIDLSTAGDSIKVMLTTSAYVPNQDTHDFKDDVTNEVVGTGYTAGGIALATKTLTYTGATNVVMFDADDVSWGGATFTSRVAVIYDATPGTDATRPLIGYVLFDVDQVVTAGTFSIVWDPAGIFKITVA